MTSSTMDTSSCAGTLNHQDVNISFASSPDSDMVHISKRQKVAHQITPYPAKFDFDDEEFEEIDLTSEKDSDSLYTVDLSSENDSDSLYTVDMDSDSSQHPPTEQELDRLNLEPLSKQFNYELSYNEISSRSYVTDDQYEDIGFMHFSTLRAMWQKFEEPLMFCIGQSPASSCSPTACSTPTTDVFDGFDGDWTGKMESVSPTACSEDLVELLEAAIVEHSPDGPYESIIEQMMADVVPAPEPASQSSYHNGIFEQLAADFARGEDQSELFVLSESSEPSTPSRGEGSYSCPEVLQHSTLGASTEKTSIDPYGVPAGAPPANLDEDELKDPWVIAALSNSGVSILTDYSIVYSPRQEKSEIRRILGNYAPWYIQDAKPELIRKCNIFVISIKAEEHLFTPFSYTNFDQPRTRIARLMEGEPVSPKTKVPTAIM